MRFSRLASMSLSEAYSDFFPAASQTPEDATHVRQTHWDAFPGQGSDQLAQHDLRLLPDQRAHPLGIDPAYWPTITPRRLRPRAGLPMRRSPLPDNHS